MAPSWGRRDSVIFMFANNFNLVVKFLSYVFGIYVKFCKSPSTRNRTIIPSSLGSKWMSDAFDFAADMII